MSHIQGRVTVDYAHELARQWRPTLSDGRLAHRGPRVVLESEPVVVLESETIRGVQEHASAVVWAAKPRAA